MSRRVVVTGLGAVTGVAVGARATWRGLLAGESGIARISRFDPSDLPCQIAAEVKGFDPASVVPEHEVRKFDPFALFGMYAAQEALTDAGLAAGGYDPDRAGVIFGVG